jgi:tetratricopeptide (TPR) repeat protein
MSDEGFAAFAEKKLVSLEFLNPQTRKLSVKDTPELKKLQIQFETVLEHRLFNEALVYIEKILKINRHNPSALFNKGTVLMELHRWSEALDCFNEKLVIVEDHAKTYANKAQCTILKLLDDEHELESDNSTITDEELHNSYSEALRSLERAIELNSEDVDHHISLKGIALEGLERYDEALEIFETLSKKYPNEKRYLMKIRNLSQGEKRITFCDKILEIDPEDFGSLYEKGEHFHSIGGEIWKNGSTLLAEKNVREPLEKAIEYYDKALNGKNKDEIDRTFGFFAVSISKSNALMLLGKYEDTIKCLEKIESPNVKDKVMVLETTATAYAALKDWKNCTKYYYKILDLDPKNITALVGLGKSLNSLGQMDESQVYFEMAEELGWDEIHDEYNFKQDLKRLEK